MAVTSDVVTLGAAALAGVVAVGALTGFLAGLTSSAGTYLAVALLALVLADAHLAVGTTAVYALVLCLWGGLAHYRAGRFLPDLALAIGLPAAGTAVVGAWLAERLPDHVLILGMTILTAAVVLTTLIGGGRSDRAEGTAFAARRSTYAVAAVAGLLVGLLQGLFGVGGGFLLLPLLAVGLRVPTRLAVAGALVAAVPGLLAGAVSHLLLGNVAPAALGALLLGALPMTWVGTRATGRVAPATVRYVVLGLLTVSSATLVAVGG